MWLTSDSQLLNKKYIKKIILKRVHLTKQFFICHTNVYISTLFVYIYRNILKLLMILIDMLNFTLVYLGLIFLKWKNIYFLPFKMQIQKAEFSNLSVFY